MTNILPISLNSLYIIAGAILVEFIVFLIIAAKKKLNILRIFFAVLTGNVLSSLYCIFIPGGRTQMGYYTWLIIAFALALFTEWFIDIAFFKNKKIIEEGQIKPLVSNTRLFFCSLFGNLITFLVIAILEIRHILL